MTLIKNVPYSISGGRWGPRGVELYAVIFEDGGTFFGDKTYQEVGGKQNAFQIAGHHLRKCLVVNICFTIKCYNYLQF